MPVNPKFIRLSRDLRKNQTPWEKKLWMHLKGRKFGGFKFRRQMAIEPYIYDFGCYEKKLIIELDGSEHMRADIQRKDKEKEDSAKVMGYRVIRFWNSDIENNMEGVLESIRRELQ